MPYYEDLTKCDYFKSWPNLVAVGWLSSSHQYAKGSVRKEFLSKLIQLQAKAVQDLFNYVMFGFHICDLCSVDRVSEFQVVEGNKRISIGRKNLFVPASDDRVFVSPSTMIHYIIEHGYCPPLEYQEAVMRCPPMASCAYYREMRARKTVIWSLWTFINNIHFAG